MIAATKIAIVVDWSCSYYLPSLLLSINDIIAIRKLSTIWSNLHCYLPTSLTITSLYIHTYNNNYSL
jgi:hypothetical protein